MKSYPGFLRGLFHKTMTFSDPYGWWKKSQTTTWDGAKALFFNGINYQPQLVQPPDFWTINSIKQPAWLNGSSLRGFLVVLRLVPLHWECGRMASGGLAPCRRCENRPRYQRGRGKHTQMCGGKRGKFSERFVQELGTLDVLGGRFWKNSWPPPKKNAVCENKIKRCFFSRCFKGRFMNSWASLAFILMILMSEHGTLTQWEYGASWESNVFDDVLLWSFILCARYGIDTPQNTPQTPPRQHLKENVIRVKVDSSIMHLSKMMLIEFQWFCWIGIQLLYWIMKSICEFSIKKKSSLGRDFQSPMHKLNSLFVSFTWNHSY